MRLIKFFVKEIPVKNNKKVTTLTKKSFQSSSPSYPDEKPLSLSIPSFSVVELNNDDASNSSGFTLEFIIKSMELSAISSQSNHFFSITNHPFARYLRRQKTFLS
jgi:hypothetical protein